MARRLLVAVLTLSALAAGAQVVQAKSFFAGYSGRTLVPGELIESQLVNCNGYCGREIGGRLAVLVPAVPFRQICAAKRWPLARITRSGRLSFVMPDVPSGRYALAAAFFVKNPYNTSPKKSCRLGFLSAPFQVNGLGG
jgi:hypothetical protein